MKMTSLSCPTCGAGIKIDIKGRDTIFCPYCGNQILCDDDITITHNININTRYTEDSEVEKERRLDRQNEREHQEFKWAIWLLVGMITVLVALIGLLVLMDYKNDIADKKAIEEGKIQIGISSYDIEEKKLKYQGVVSQLEAAGFSNITVVDLDDAGLFTKKADTIDSISVDGDTSFSSDHYYDPEVKIIISYH